MVEKMVCFVLGCWPCPPWPSIIAGLWRAVVKLKERCVGIQKKIELIYMFLFKVIESVPEPFMETCFCSKKLLGRFAQSSWDLEKAPDAFVGVSCSNWLQWRTTSSGQRDNELRTGTSIGVTILF